ncbi:glycosyltransferase family 2 protein [Clostridium oryzae]|uniref:Putative glycosyltransferase CsbB n=1 Tax=Clostridium oryzae TaxID=1450648 RepID=A0A1V4INI2_9CLOT|nr:glycosyltransferase family 2 protein [Clostridium oryzae]OPJ61394.1 putative glycosyltransferase CsbB [Clostridium oryzae]
MNLLTVIIPCYNEEKVLPLFYARITEVAEKMKELADFEFIFVDDGSTDNTLFYLKEIEKHDDRVNNVQLSRNFGKEAAIYAGLQHSRGNYVALIDADLQNPPEMILDMYKGITEEGYDCVATRRITRDGEPPIRSFFARKFYRIFNKISTADVVDGAFDYRLMTRQMVDIVLEMKENNRFTKGIFGWIGFKTKWLEFENVKRAAGESKWSFWALFKYAVEGIVDFSITPLFLSMILGVIFLSISIIALIVQLIHYVCTGSIASNMALILSTICLIGGLQFFCIGILGEYTGRTYIESKRRPIYIEKKDGRNYEK